MCAKSMVVQASLLHNCCGCTLTVDISGFHMGMRFYGLPTVDAAADKVQQQWNYHMKIFLSISLSQLSHSPNSVFSLATKAFIISLNIPL